MKNVLQENENLAKLRQGRERENSMRLPNALNKFET